MNTPFSFSSNSLAYSQSEYLNLANQLSLAYADPLSFSLAMRTLQIQNAYLLDPAGFNTKMFESELKNTDAQFGHSQYDAISISTPSRSVSYSNLEALKLCKHEASEGSPQAIEIKEESYIKEEPYKTEISPSSSSLLDGSESAINLGSEYSPFSEKVEEEVYNGDFRSAAFRRKIRKMIQLVLSKIGKESAEEIEKIRLSILKQDPLLHKLFEHLVKKYHSAKKFKEEFIRYIMRKAWKVIKKKSTKDLKVKGKKASLLLCKRYFSDKFNQLDNVNVDNDEEIVDFFMPYNEKSKNKSINMSFVKEIFSSHEFVSDYQEFLESFDDLLKQDNDKKFEALENTLIECLETNSFHKIGSMKVFPWLDTWMEETKVVAKELIKNKPLISSKKPLIRAIAIPLNPNPEKP